MSDRAQIPAFGLYGEVNPLPDVVHCEAFSARAPIHDWRISPHRHGHMSQLFLFRDGAVRANVDGRVLDLSGGQFLYVPELCVHEFVFEPDMEGSVLSFPSSVARALGPNGDDVFARLARPIFGAVSARLAELVDLLVAASGADTAFRTQVAVGLMHAVLAHVAEHGVSDGVTDRLRGLDGLITAHASEGWTASRYAAALSVTTGHLSRLCRAAYGVGAAAYIERRVMSEACRMLAFTQLPISEIGYRLGFQDPSYFSKRFAHVQGRPPSAYRAGFMDADA